MTKSTGLWGEETKFFHSLTPENVMEASELLGMRLTGKILTLNSLENRVFEIELAEKRDVDKHYSPNHIVLKFYRPGRWTKDQILEEHQFLDDLNEFEVPVVAPITIKNESLFFHEKTGLLFSISPKVLGRLKDEFNQSELEQAGRLIGRIHNIGQTKNFTHRLHFTADTYIKINQTQLSLVRPVEFKSFFHYIELLNVAFDLINPIIKQLNFQRIHGDFHRGNILWSLNGPIAVDFDDALTGPIEQDLWPLVPGNDSYSLQDKDYFLGAYKEMTRKDHINTQYTETFRTMRLIHFNTWIAKRWQDHAFQRMFPQFISENYWDQQLLDLRSQISLIQDARTYF
jgi:Ser/Thr protein kinase RdoA (MazF antagonist)